MDILLVDPPYSSLKGVPTDCGYNIGLTSLAAYLRAGGVETGILMGDLLVDLPSADGWLTSDLSDYAQRQSDYARAVDDETQIVWRRLSDLVRRYKPLAVGLTYLTPLEYSVGRIARLVKQIDPGIRVIVGSAHPTFCPQDVMLNPDIDFAVVGEGEIPLLRLLVEMKGTLPNWSSVPGIYFRNERGQLQGNPVPDLIHDLDSLPVPARDLVLNCDFHAYRAHSILTTRGCPYNCSFCADKRIWGGRVRRRSVANVIAELALLKNTYDPELVNIQDGTFTFDKQYLEDFSKALINSGMNLKWGCTARYDNLDRQLLGLMKRAGCYGLYFGLESGSDRMLKMIDKKTTVKQILSVSNMAHDIGITCVTSVMVGLPDETKEDVEATLRLMSQVKTDIFDVNSFVPLPGSRLYDDYDGRRKRPCRLADDGYKSLDNHFSRHIAASDLRAYLREAYRIADEARQKTLLRYQLSVRS